ncbi:Nn.00g017660.m01.CDS01 [Neocucurbitaria sp. VM-36]
MNKNNASPLRDHSSRVSKRPHHNQHTISAPEKRLGDDNNDDDDDDDDDILIDSHRAVKKQSIVDRKAADIEDDDDEVEFVSSRSVRSRTHTTAARPSRSSVTHYTRDLTSTVLAPSKVADADLGPCPNCGEMLIAATLAAHHAKCAEPQRGSMSTTDDLGTCPRCSTVLTAETIAEHWDQCTGLVGDQTAVIEPTPATQHNIKKPGRTYKERPVEPPQRYPVIQQWFQLRGTKQARADAISADAAAGLQTTLSDEHKAFVRSALMPNGEYTAQTIQSLVQQLGLSPRAIKNFVLAEQRRFRGAQRAKSRLQSMRLADLPPDESFEFSFSFDTHPTFFMQTLSLAGVSNRNPQSTVINTAKPEADVKPGVAAPGASRRPATQEDLLSSSVLASVPASVSNRPKPRISKPPPYHPPAISGQKRMLEEEEDDYNDVLGHYTKSKQTSALKHVATNLSDDDEDDILFVFARSLRPPASDLDIGPCLNCGETPTAATLAAHHAECVERLVPSEPSINQEPQTPRDTEVQIQRRRNWIKTADERAILVEA